MISTNFQTVKEAASDCVYNCWDNVNTMDREQRIYLVAKLAFAALVLLVTTSPISAVVSVLVSSICLIRGKQPTQTDKIKVSDAIEYVKKQSEQKEIEIFRYTPAEKQAKEEASAGDLQNKAQEVVNQVEVNYSKLSRGLMSKLFEVATVNFVAVLLLEGFKGGMIAAGSIVIALLIGGQPYKSGSMKRGEALAELEGINRTNPNTEVRILVYKPGPKEAQQSSLAKCANSEKAECAANPEEIKAS